MDEITPYEKTVYDDALRLTRIVNSILRKRCDRFPVSPLDYSMLMEAAADMEAWFEDNDPKSMGWVGDNGLP